MYYLSHRKDFNRIAKAISFIRNHHQDQPDLATVAKHIGLSDCHFQRMFTSWAGISPKRFLQYLTVEYAKSRISRTKSLLDLSLDIDLSGPGRLHDLFIHLEAMSPGEFKTAGAKLQIRYGIHQSPFGYCLLATTVRGICNISFLDTRNRQAAERILRQEWNKATIIYDKKTTQPLHDRIFNPVIKNGLNSLAVLVKGTNFQIQVWRALLRIPYAGITSYQQIAEMVNRPTAARAVGTAIAHNPVAYLIPCHRVIQATGMIGNYRWGQERKINMLGWEAGQLEARIRK